MTCLGCGGVVCPVCEDRAKAIIEHSHWPLETSISRAALDEVESAIRIRLHDFAKMEAFVRSELENLANVIRSHLQHDYGFPVATTDEDWLS